MSSPNNSTHPVHTLREHITALEAAITLALADPKKDPVHRLRTSTRRIESQIELLSLLPDLPEHAKPAKKAGKHLKKLRRTAGTVRDLDVQRDLLKDLSASGKLRKEARDLRRTLKHHRSSEAAKLTLLLKQDQQKLAPMLEDLLKALKPAETLALSTAQLSRLTLDWYQHNTPVAQTSPGPDSLHAIRKSAKLARYIAESGAPTLAQAFESIQQAGGTWHDFLTLTDIATEHLGPKAALTQAFTHRRETALHEYLASLQNAPA